MLTERLRISQNKQRHLQQFKHLAQTGANIYILRAGLALFTAAHVKRTHERVQLRPAEHIARSSTVVVAMCIVTRAIILLFVFALPQLQRTLSIDTLRDGKYQK